MPEIPQKYEPIGREPREDTMTDSRYRHWFGGALLTALLLLAPSLNCTCPGGIGDDDDAVPGDDDDDTGIADDDVADDDSVVEPFSLAGEVFVIPVYYDLDEQNVWTRIELSWFDVSDDGYTYGMLYVGITEGFETTDSVLHFSSEVASADPAVDGTPYAFTPVEWPLDEAYVMAVADTYHDGFISPWDEMAFAPEGVDTTGAPETDVDVIIDMEFVWENGVWVPGNHHGVGGGGGGGDDDDDDGGGGDDDDDDGGGGGGGGWGFPGTPCDISLAGDEFLQDSPYTSSSGESAVAIYDEDGNGPYWTAWPGRLDGANQGVMLPWEIDPNCDFTALIYGVWDHNDNTLMEPGDEWGATVNGQYGDEINPWAITDIDVVGMMVRVPVEGVEQPMPRPYVSISGVVYTDGSFAFGGLPASSMMYILAAKHQLPDLDAYPTYILLGEDKVWSSQQITGVDQAGDEIPYEVWVPTDTETVMYALIDTDGDTYIELVYQIVNGFVALTTETSNIEADLQMTYIP